MQLKENYEFDGVYGPVDTGIPGHMLCTCILKTSNKWFRVMHNDHSSSENENGP